MAVAAAAAYFVDGSTLADAQVMLNSGLCVCDGTDVSARHGFQQHKTGICTVQHSIA